MRKWLGGGYGAGASQSPLAPSGSSSAAPTGPEKELSKAFYEEDVKALRNGMELLFTNKIEEAETTFKAGFLTPAGAIRPPLPAYARDNRASYAFPYALSAMFRGLASLENEQLRDCLDRLRTCQEICDSSMEWLGHKLLRGVVALSLGIVELNMQKYGRGAIDVVRAWWLLRGVEEEVNSFDGPERLEVRSLMQLVCGAIEVAVSSLPPGLLRAAKFIGFKGDMDHARELIRQCYSEDGLLAPVAALFISIFLIEWKPAIGVPPTAQEIERVENILKWSDERFKGSCFFLLVRAGLHAQNRDLDQCAACVDELEPLVSTYPAFALLVHWTRARNALLLRKWSLAGEHYEAAIDVHIKVQRRSWVPCMSLFAGLAYAAAGDNTRRDAQWGVVMAYKAMKKSNWRDEDVRAFEFVEEFMAKPPPNPDIELWYFLKCMSQMRGTPKGAAAFVIADLQSRSASLVPDDACRAWLVQAELYRIDGDIDDALRCIDEALSLADSISPRMKKNGLLPEIWFTKSVACIAAGRLSEAKASLEEINSSSMKPMSKSDRMEYDFKKNAVSKWLLQAESDAGGAQSAATVDDGGEDEEDGFWSADEDDEDAEDA